jgi:hypothetical protein
MDGPERVKIQPRRYGTVYRTSRTMESATQQSVTLRLNLSQRTRQALNGHTMYHANATGTPMTIKVTQNSAQHDRYKPERSDRRHITMLNAA